MGHETPGEITTLLRQWGEGDQGVLSDLVSLAYEDLQAIAVGYLQRERPNHTLQATALVHELYLKLTLQRSAVLTSREHFYAFAALMMRRILTDHARRSAAQKRPAPSGRVPLHEDLAWVDATSEQMISLDHAMTELESQAPRAARCLDLRVFLGSTVEETAEVLGISKATASREIDFAVAWLYRRLAGGEKSLRGLRDIG